MSLSASWLFSRDYEDNDAFRELVRSIPLWRMEWQEGLERPARLGRGLWHLVRGPALWQCAIGAQQPHHSDSDAMAENSIARRTTIVYTIGYTIGYTLVYTIVYSLYTVYMLQCRCRSSWHGHRLLSLLELWWLWMGVISDPIAYTMSCMWTIYICFGHAWLNLTIP